MENENIKNIVLRIPEDIQQDLDKVIQDEKAKGINLSINNAILYCIKAKANDNTKEEQERKELQELIKKLINQLEK